MLIRGRVEKGYSVAVIISNVIYLPVLFKTRRFQYWIRSPFPGGTYSYVAQQIELDCVSGRGVFHAVCFRNGCHCADLCPEHTRPKDRVPFGE
jgi:hypothetical protein